ncbi:hypothetical protein BS50DRAFT_149345 [Corynespora cassiicola Philippines]|uniref:Uncharacterized protein n=1 Tax=Corynespora cassiicola Philippines TaxID=1448308 RepID=A0A2T2N7L4_CORCC|nr:hypothetical protein BS50DRAFT_149345 [Corynespora cassiicola Philippines]
MLWPGRHRTCLGMLKQQEQTWLHGSMAPWPPCTYLGRRLLTHFSWLVPPSVPTSTRPLPVAPTDVKSSILAMPSPPTSAQPAPSTAQGPPAGWSGHHVEPAFGLPALSFRA